MESFGGDEFDLNWVCCLLDDVPNNCSDSVSKRSKVLLPTPCLDSFLSSPSHSVDNHKFCESLDGLEECCRKRIRGSITTSSSKACREKQRRDHVNKRFLELIAILESGVTTPKFDKATILTDAIRTVKLLREETSSLTSQNGELKQKISELKAEKNVLGDEKYVLVSEKEEIEQKIRGLDAHWSW